MRRVKPGFTYSAFWPVTWSKSLAWSPELGKNNIKATYRMHTNNRMLIPHWLATDEIAILPCVLCLAEAVVLSCQAFQQFLDRLGKQVVGRGLRNPGSVATGGWDFEQ